MACSTYKNNHAGGTSMGREKERVRFARTDQLNSLAKKLVRNIHTNADVPIDNALLRKRTKEVLVAIEKGIIEIPISAVASAPRETRKERIARNKERRSRIKDNASV